MNKDLFNKKHIDEDLYKVRKLPYQKDDMHQLKTLFDSAQYNKNYYGANYGKGKRKVVQNIKDQRVTFKMSYSKSLNSHTRYVTNYMVQKEKEGVEDKPELYGTDIEEYKANMDDLNFKCIISPENQNVDLEVLSREFIKRLETLTGYKFYWEGAIHNDTAHRHCHICINGKDQTGKKVSFQKEWIRNTMRELLSYVTTQMVGERTSSEIDAERKRLPQSKRWTKLDERLEKLPSKLNIESLPPELQSRLMFLTELNLAKKNDKKHYTLDTEWKNVLVATGRYNTYLENYIELNQNLKLYSGGLEKGKVIKVITFDKDEAWNDAVIIKNKNDENIYIPIWQLKKENLIGENIKVTSAHDGIGRTITDRDIKVYKGYDVNRTF